MSGTKMPLISVRNFAITLTVVHFLWFVTLVVTAIFGRTDWIPLKLIQKVGRFGGILLNGPDRSPFQFEMTAILCSAYQFIASCHLVTGQLLDQEVLKKFWAFEHTMALVLYGFYCLRNLAPVSLEHHDCCAFSPAQIIPFYGISIFYIYNVVSKLNWKSPVPPKGKFQKNDMKPSEFLQAFTALSIVGFVAVSVVSLLTVGYIADNYDIATEWMSKEKFVAAVAVGIGIWGVLSKEFLDAYFSSIAKPWMIWPILAASFSYGAFQLVYFARHDIYFDNFAVLYLLGIFLPTSATVVAWQAAKIKFRRHISSHD